MTTIESPEAGRAERVGLALGRGYFAAVAAVATPIRRCPTPTWHWRAGYRCGVAARQVAVRGTEFAEVRVRCAPHRLRTGLSKVLRWLFAQPTEKGETKKGETKKSESKKSEGKGLVRFSVAGGLMWWGLEWAARADVPVWPLAAGGAALLLVVAYVAGSDPDPETETETETRPAPRRRGRRGDHQERAAARLLWAIGQLLEDRSALHITELADQINTRNRAAAGRRVLTAAHLRALLEDLGAPVRDQMVIGSHTGPGIDAEDWQRWRGDTRRRVGVKDVPETLPEVATKPGEPEKEATTPALPRAETAPIETETPQVRGDDQDISARDLGSRVAEPPPAPAPRPSAEQDRLLAHVRAAIGTDRGAHLRDILATAQAAGDYTDWTVTRLRRALESAGIRVENKLWLRGGNTRGVLASNLPEET